MQNELVQKRRRWLRDIVGYAEAIFKRTDGETSETFMADNLLLVDPEIVERCAEIPWLRVRAIGNVIRHEYGEIESSAVWATISGSGLRDLVSVAKRELESSNNEAVRDGSTKVRPLHPSAQ
jgi:uncharacterized protein with HEPN domain